MLHRRCNISLSELLKSNPERRYLMFGGKGGLGKTTFSAAAGYHLAQQGHKVLVFSVDPQASLSDIFEQDLFGKGAVKVMDNLWAQEIDADRRIKAYQEEIRGKIRDMYGFTDLPEEIEQYIQAASAEPAMEESAIFDAVVDIMVAGDFDYYIYDLVPLGHALYYLSMATVYDAWIAKITALREQMREYDQVAAQLKHGDQKLDEDAILEELQYIRDRIQTSSRILTDRERTAFFFVLTPEEMVIQDTLKAAELFRRFQVPLSGYVVNRVLPTDLWNEAIPEYLRHRIEMQERYLAKIKETFGRQVLTRVPELERDVTGLPMIARVAEYLFS